MGTRLFGSVRAGTTSLSLDALLLKTADGTPDTGLAYSDLTAYYYRQGASATTSVTLSALANLNSAFSSGGVKEIADGTYRVDWPDAAFGSLTPSDWVELTIKHGTTSLYKERVALEQYGASDVRGEIGTAGAGLTNLGDTRVAYLDAAITSRSTFNAGTTSVTVGGYASGQSPATLVLDATTSGHTTSGTVGAALIAAAVDPWGVSLPGSYSAGTAGYIVGGSDPTIETAQGATSTTLTLQAGTAFTSLPAAPAEAWITITSGPGAGTSARVLGLATGVVTVASWPKGQPTSSSRYQITATPDGRVKLAPDGLDSVTLETGINARQGLTVILATAAGVVSGADTGSVVIKGAGVSATRVAATCDQWGNRTSPVLTPPA